MAELPLYSRPEGAQAELEAFVFGVFMCWKSVRGARRSVDLGVQGLDGVPVVFRRAQEVEILGNMLDARGSTRCSLDHRELKTEICYW